MKTKTFLSFIIIMVAAQNAFSQGNNWRITGNNNTDSTNFIGTTTNTDFNIKVNNKPRINVDADDLQGTAKNC